MSDEIEESDSNVYFFLNGISGYNISGRIKNIQICGQKVQMMGITGGSLTLLWRRSIKLVSRSSKKRHPEIEHLMKTSCTSWCFLC